MTTVEKTLTIKKGSLKAHKENGLWTIYEKDFEEFEKFIERPGPKVRGATKFKHHIRIIREGSYERKNPDT